MDGAQIGAVAAFVAVVSPVIIYLMRVEGRLVRLETMIAERLPARAAK